MDDNVIPYPGATGDMDPKPRDEMRDYEATGRLEGKVALVTGGDSGIASRCATPPGLREPGRAAASGQTRALR